MRIYEYIKNLQALGRYSFTIEEVEQITQRSRLATLAALERLINKGEIISPSQGFYIIVSPEFRAMKGPPPDQFIVLLMEHLKLDYYVGLLSAAQYYGAAHQQPQVFQVMLEKNKKKITYGRTSVTYIAKKNINQFSQNSFKTPRGYIKVATPEVIAMDLVTYPKHAGGLSQVATVLQELTENISSDKLMTLVKTSNECAWIQRLGYLFSAIESNSLSDILLNYLKTRNFYFKPLVPGNPIKGFKRDQKWKLIINSEVETDL